MSPERSVARIGTAQLDCGFLVFCAHQPANIQNCEKTYRVRTTNAPATSVDCDRTAGHPASPTDRRRQQTDTHIEFEETNIQKQKTRIHVSSNTQRVLVPIRRRVDLHRQRRSVETCERKNKNQQHDGNNITKRSTIDGVQHTGFGAALECEQRLHDQREARPRARLLVPVHICRRDHLPTRRTNIPNRVTAFCYRLGNIRLCRER
jgi:hypothetical protein